MSGDASGGGTDWTSLATNAALQLGSQYMKNQASTQAGLAAPSSSVPQIAQMGGQMGGGSGPLFKNGPNPSSNYALEQFIQEILRKKMGGGDITGAMPDTQALTGSLGGGGF